MGEEGRACSLPRKNCEYAKQEYWEERFASEKHYEWLESPESLLPLLLPLLDPSSVILTVGCGNSELSDALVAHGFPFIFNLDFSPTVLHTKHQRERQAISKYQCSSSPPASSPPPGSSLSSSSSSASRPPVMEYLCADMTHLDFLRPNSFDVVIDKAAMDALMTEEGSAWEPRLAVRQAADRYLAGVSRCLNPGLFVQITFQQPHFRRRYMLNRFSLNLNDESTRAEDGRLTPREWISAKTRNFPSQSLPDRWHISEAYGWSFFHTDIEKDTPGCFSNFLFLAQKDD